MAKDKGKQKVEEAEDWCFVCYDGGNLLVCDHKGCEKVYHPRCVGQRNSVLRSEISWTCSRHSCSTCRASPQFYCLCCPTAFCNLCVRADFVPATSDKGLCKKCYELTQCCKKNAENNSKRDKIVLKDDLRMFNGYVEIIMEQEGLTFEDLCRARSKIPDSVVVEDKDAKDKISDGERVKDSAPIDMSPGKRKMSEIEECDGRPSKAVIEFLSSIGVAAPEKLTRCHVDIQISKYILRENLFVDEEQETVSCDEKLNSLFQKKLIKKNQIYDLLLVHFNATSGQTNLDATQRYSGNKDEDIGAESKRKRTLITDKIPLEDKEDSPVQKSDYDLVTSESEHHRTLSTVEVPLAVQKSPYASIVADNIKLVYLRRSLIKELLKDPDNFEDKVVGSFVRVNKTPLDSSVKPAFQLLQVTGIKEKTANTNNNKEILFEVSCLQDSIPIDMLNDNDILEEECLNLQQRMRDGMLRKPTVMELEQKAYRLHEDITKNWIERELIRLQNRITYYNEKKRVAAFNKCWEERERLNTSPEQQRLLTNLPRVIAEEVELHPTTGDSSKSNRLIESDRQKSPAETKD